MKQSIRYVLLPALILIPVLLLLFLLPEYSRGEGHYPLTGRYVETASGQHLLYRNTDTGAMRYVFLLPHEDPAMFDAFETGDPLRVQAAPRIQKTADDICYVNVWAPKKVRNTTDIPQLTDEVLIHIAELDVKFSP